MKCLVISPFSSFPADAGHRKRVFATTQLLKELGYEIHFLLFAFEDNWRIRYQDEQAKGLRRQWDQVYIHIAQSNVGHPPQNGTNHELDEWWDTTLEPYLKQLNQQHFFDVTVIHNVWLSKAFDFCNQYSDFIIDSHDIFYKRLEVAKQHGVIDSFFLPKKTCEIFGYNRANCVLTIQKAEALELIEELDESCTPINIPYIEDESSTHVGSLSYISESSVTFGILASHHAYNVAGFQELCDELVTEIAKTHAPVKIIVGGTICKHIKTDLNIELMGYINSIDEFYNQCDFVIAPVFCGTGFKVKVLEAMAKGKPIIAANHAALGSFLSIHFQHKTPAEMARAITLVAMSRPPLSETREEVKKAFTAYTLNYLQSVHQFSKRLKALNQGLNIKFEPKYIEDFILLWRIIENYNPDQFYGPMFLESDQPITFEKLPKEIQSRPLKRIDIYISDGIKAMNLTKGKLIRKAIDGPHANIMDLIERMKWYFNDLHLVKFKSSEKLIKNIEGKICIISNQEQFDALF